MAKSKIKNLIVAPLIASAIFLASPGGFTAASSPTQRNKIEVHNISNTENTPDTKKGIAGKVTKVSGNIVIVSTKDDTEYTVDVSDATIMKEGAQPDANPEIVSISDIHTGDALAVRGVIHQEEDL
jgi:hypothetical protein